MRYSWIAQEEAEEYVFSGFVEFASSGGIQPDPASVYPAHRPLPQATFVASHNIPAPPDSTPASPAVPSTGATHLLRVDAPASSCAGRAMLLLPLLRHAAPGRAVPTPAHSAAAYLPPLPCGSRPNHCTAHRADSSPVWPAHTPVPTRARDHPQSAPCAPPAPRARPAPRYPPRSADTGLLDSHCRCRRSSAHAPPGGCVAGRSLEDR